MLIAIKNLMNERSRFLTSLFGVSFAVVLILVMSGIYVGTLKQVTTYIDHSDGKVWVMQPGVDQMFRSVSWLDISVVEEVNSVSSVNKATSFLGVPSSLAHNGTQTAYYLIGYNPTDREIGPWKLAEGRNIEKSGETVLDSVLAKKNNIELGDTVTLIDEKFTVVGLSDETAAVGNFYAFVSFEDAKTQLHANNRTSFVLAEPIDGVTVQELSDSIKTSVAGVDAMPAETFAENSREIVRSMVGRPLITMIAIGILVGFALIALSVLSVASEQMRDFGILRAIGVGSQQLYVTVVIQALVLGIGGYVLGVAITYLAQLLIQGQVGDVAVSIPLWLIGAMALGSVIMAVLACLVPAKRVSRLDPAAVFRQ